MAVSDVSVTDTVSAPLSVSLNSSQFPVLATVLHDHILSIFIFYPDLSALLSAYVYNFYLFFTYKIKIKRLLELRLRAATFQSQQTTKSKPHYYCH